MAENEAPSTLPDPPSPNHVWDQATESWQERGPGPGKFIDVEEVEDLIDRLFIRARIRRSIPHRKSVKEHKPDRLAALLEEAGFTIKELLDYIKEKEDGEQTTGLRGDGPEAAEEDRSDGR
jgi:hypothetical protein